ncbi:MAG: hypothetical protein JRM77_06570 [Nitrososphaerota archaeon]|jgi:Holliday junction resolvase|nr:hypothetical protein [Nitrososphaerota archaeon]
MIVAKRILPSKKRLGVHEKRLIDSLAAWFLKLGYDVIPHARLNLAWGPVLSDIDLLAIKRGTVTVIEVKSENDNLSRAAHQLDKIIDFVDYAFVATERMPRQWDHGKFGLIRIRDGEIEVIRFAQRLARRPTLDSILALPKSSLLRTAGIRETDRVLKDEVARTIFSTMRTKELRAYLKEEALCGNTFYH